MAWLILLRNAFIIYVVYVFIRIVKDFISVKKVEAGHVATIQYLQSKIGHNIGVQGPIRVGKNSIASGMAHDITNIIISMILKKRKEFKEICFWVDFSIIDNRIQQLHEEVDFPLSKENYLHEFLSNYLGVDKEISIDSFDEETYKMWTSFLDSKKVKKYNYFEIYNILMGDYSKLFDGSVKNRPASYNNHLQKKELKDMFFEYIIATCRLLDNNFVMANFNLFSRITNNYSVHCDLDDFAIKDQFLLHRFKFVPYSVVVMDEALISDYTNLNWQATAKADPGIDVLMRLTGNMFKETVYIIFIGQNLGRLNKSIRELLTTHISLFGYSNIATKEYYNKWLNTFRSINDCAMQLTARFKGKKANDYLNRDNIYKRMNLRLLDQLNLNLSESYLIFKSVFYTREEDVGKAPSIDNPFINDFALVFPTIFSWGTYDTHYYQFALKEMLLNAYKVPKDEIDDYYKAYYAAQKTTSIYASELEGYQVFKKLIAKRKITKDSSNIDHTIENDDISY